MLPAKLVGGSVAPLTTFGSREFPLAPTLRLTIGIDSSFDLGTPQFRSLCASTEKYLALSRGEAWQLKNLTDDG